MHIQSSLAIGLLASAATAASDTVCGTSRSSHALRTVLENQRKGDLGVGGEREQVSIDTYIHVLAASDKLEDNYLTDEIVQGQVDLLNESYKPYNFSFNLIETTKTINESWADPGNGPVGDSDEPALRAALRKGGYDALNIFYIRNMIPHGRCNLPVPNPSKENITADGCILRPKTPGTADPRYGLVTVHEVGHWLGLEHTFKNGCEEPGDGVDDTPAEAEPVGSQNCGEPGRDTCPDKPGLDPTDNFMTYANDTCGPQKFTPGQNERMHNLWTKLRAPFESGD